MLESYVFLSQMPEDVLLKKQKEVIASFSKNGFDSFIYFISDGYHTKIGKADNVFSRIKELQVGNPRRLILIGVCVVNKKEVVEQEKWLHEQHSNKAIRGEWFFLTDSDIYQCFTGAKIRFPDYFADPVFFESHGFYKYCSDIQRNINDRIHDASCKTPYYPKINRKK